MEDRIMISEHREKFFSESQEMPFVSREAAAVENGVILAYQDAEARGNMYLFLASVYLRPPNQALVRHITAKDFLKELSWLFGIEALGHLKKIATTGHCTKNVAALKQDYMDLFAVPTGRYVTPFEDVYREKTVEGKQERGPLMGERAVAVRRIYREAGAEMDRDCKELPTHIGVELSFMSFLCEREAEAIRHEESDALLNQMEKMVMDSIRYRELQIRFLQEHLNAWFPQLCQSIQANAKSQFYKGLTLIAEEFLAQDTAALLAQDDSEKHMLT
jgi:TorA maturation chaperone TorD